MHSYRYGCFEVVVMYFVILQLCCTFTIICKIKSSIIIIIVIAGSSIDCIVNKIFITIRV